MRPSSGARPPKIDDEQWGHTKALYKAYGDNPLWLSPEGLHEVRTKALTNAILAANTDGMRMDDYPIGALAQAVATLKQTKTPTADQLATADVLLTASYVALGEDLMTGQVRTVQQAWHVDPEEENVDSALVRDLRYAHLDKALATLRPADDDYSGLSKELQRWRTIVAKGGWQPVPAIAKNIKPGGAASPAVLSAIRNRLAVEGIPVTPSNAPPDSAGNPATNAASTFDRDLAGAVAEFQRRHQRDSALGSKRRGERLRQLPPRPDRRQHGAVPLAPADIWIALHLRQRSRVQARGL
jgi:murein L,D-transpeptidase YcbB/YkuD